MGSIWSILCSNVSGWPPFAIWSCSSTMVSVMSIFSRRRPSICARGKGPRAWGSWGRIGAAGGVVSSTVGVKIGSGRSSRL